MTLRVTMTESSLARRRNGTFATKSAQSGHSSATQRSADEVSRQLVEERFGFLKDRRVETFGEPAGDPREKITGFGALALIGQLQFYMVRFGITQPISYQSN